MADPDAPPDTHDEAAASMEGDGRKVVDGFDLVEKVASGGSTVVWEALERATGQTHALKLLQPSLNKDRDQVATLKHEQKVGAALNHPSVIHTGGFVKTKANVYLVMELFKYPNLKGALKGAPAETQANVQKIVEGVCQGLSHMHEKGWLHLDVKPDNLLIAPTGEVRVIDFSLAEKPAGGLASLFGGATIRGTRTYIAPETLLKKKKTTATDVYSLGVTLFELLAGRPPFAGNDPAHLLRQHINEKVPPASVFNENLTQDADKLLTRMLAKKPENRHQTPTEVFAEFRGTTIFKKDPQELLRELREKKEADELEGSGSRLDSRADAVRTQKGIKAPPKPQKKVRRRADVGGEAKKAAERKAKDAPQQPAAPQPPPGYPQGYPPGYPPPGYYPQPQYAPPGYAQGQPPPGQFPPGQGAPGRPGQPPPGQAPPGQYQPGQPPPGWAPQSAQGQPGQGQPGQGQPGQGQPAPAGRPPAPPQPAAQRPGAPPPQGQAAPAGGPVQVPGLTRPTEGQHASQKQVAEDDDLPLMTELPEIM